ncbi:MAG: hypothetical protein P1P86_15495 [Bacteroidales bacterium]|nr:hypothetical protein [Bacteroidales bacterium]
MSNKHRYTGFALVLAWPQTFCKEPGSWYDPVTRWLGINRNNYYRAGHAALVLVDGVNEKCHYFDFGRYHAPFKHGRVRSVDTDHDLIMNTTPKISGDGTSILNVREILEELQYNPACHGEGALYASYSRINFNDSMMNAIRMQKESPVPYGPFISGGSNCSRFVHTVILSGKPDWYRRMQLKYFIPLTPTPLSNVNALRGQTVIPVLRNNTPFIPVRPLSKPELSSTLPQPVRHPNIPENAQWLSGEGAGSWFACDFEEGVLRMTRYAPDGVIECKGVYRSALGEKHETEASTSVDYPSNCLEVTLNHNGKQVRYQRIFEENTRRAPVPELHEFFNEKL